MELFGIEANVNTVPALEEDFIPVLLWNKAYLAKARESFVIAVADSTGQRIVHRTRIRNDGTSLAADKFFVDRLLKSLLWLYGGHRVSIIGSNTMFEHLQKTYSLSGARASEVVFLSNVYDQPFFIERLSSVPRESFNKKFMSQHLNGYRIGIDINGQDRKCAAVANGKILYSEEVLWNPMEEEDPDFHFKGVLESIHTAAKRLPRIDAIGVSTTGIFVENKARNTELFQSIPAMEFSDALIELYPRAAQNMGCEILEVHSEGDVSALAGAMSLDAKGVLSLHFNHKLTAGFLDNEGNLTGWLNELAYMPINLSPDGPTHEATADVGCGSNYFSEEGVIRLARLAGIDVDESLTMREQLRVVQTQAEQGTSKSKLVFNSLGTFLGHTLAYYHSLYSFQLVLLLGRVMLGAGGDLIFNAAQKVLAKDYPVIASNMVISLPDENNRSVGQAVAAASMPEC